MDQISAEDLSPYRVYPRPEWARLRADMRQPLREDEVSRLRGFNDELDMDEVEAIYLPTSRLLNLYVHAAQELFAATRQFIGNGDDKTPFVIGVAGSVAVGKTTTARILKELLARWQHHPKVDLITTDGFLYPNSVLEAGSLMSRKGFPESYDTRALLSFLTDVKAGKGEVRAPVYSHLVYDIVPGEETVIDRPDILIVEGLNVLQPATLPPDGRGIPFVSDFFDFSIFVDAEADSVERWYIERFMRLRETAFRDPRSFFRKYSRLNDEEAEDTARGIWRTINLPNLQENILPTRQRADLILFKGDDHLISEVWLRKL